MTKEQAEGHLRKRLTNCYLIRYSEGEQQFVISVMRRDDDNPIPTIEHYKLNITKEGDQSVYEIEGTEKKFTDISSLLEFYKKNPLTSSKCTIGIACIKQSKHTKQFMTL